MINRFLTFFFSILFFVTLTPDKVNAITSDLPDCVVITHCVREDFKVNDIENAFKKWLVDSGYITEEELQEEVLGLGDLLPKGNYKLVNDVVPDPDGDMAAVGNKGDMVVAFSDTSPTDEVLGINIFPVIHQKSSTEIYVSLEDIEEA